jgi:hypothetical protein
MSRRCCSPGAGRRRVPLRRGEPAFEFDTTLQTPLVIAFFTSIGVVMAKLLACIRSSG